MGFIDQIMGAMGMEAAQTVTEEPTSNADPQRTEETKTDEVKEKAEKIQRRVGQRLGTIQYRQGGPGGQ